MCIRVLFIEDDEILSEAVMMLLQAEGYEVLNAREGRLVIGMIARYAPDAVVLDMSLPDVDGCFVACAVRDAWPELPIIFATGWGMDDTIRKALQLERTSFLQKPYEIATLVSILRAVTGT